MHKLTCIMFYHMYYSLVKYPMLNLTIVGNTESGKTSLMKRLNKKLKRQKLPEYKISIYDWKFSPTTSDDVVYFRIWDFPSQVCHMHIYVATYVTSSILCIVTMQFFHIQATTNYYFYSKQAIYLVVFKLTDGENKIKQLDRYLRNIKVCQYKCINAYVFNYIHKGVCSWMSSYGHWHS